MSLVLARTWGDGEMEEGTAYSCEGVFAQAGDGTMSVVLPNIVSDAHCTTVIEILYELRDDTPPGASWLVDLTNLESIPPALGEALNTLGAEMAGKGGLLRIATASRGSDLAAAPSPENRQP